MHRTSHLPLSTTPRLLPSPLSCETCHLSLEFPCLLSEVHVHTVGIPACAACSYHGARTIRRCSRRASVSQGAEGFDSLFRLARRHNPYYPFPTTPYNTRTSHILCGYKKSSRTASSIAYRRSSSLASPSFLFLHSSSLMNHVRRGISYTYNYV